MKILFLSRPFTNPALGTGETNVAKNLFEYLSKDGNKVDYIKKIYFQEHQSIFAIIFYDYLCTFLFLIKSIFYRYDLVFFNTPPQSVFLPLFNLTVKNSVTLVFDLFCFDHSFGLFSRYLQWLYKYAFHFSKKVITVSEENKSKILKINKNVNITVIPLGVDKGFENLQFLKREVKFDIGYIGKYKADFARKRTENILEFVKHNNSINAVIHLANKVAPEFAEKLSSTNKNNNTIKFYGKISDEEKVKFFNEICFLYFPSKFEGFGIPLVEAFWASVLPIIHKDAEIPEIIKSHCYLIENPSEITNILQNFKNNPLDYQNFIQSNYEYAKTFSYENFVVFLKELTV